MRRTIAYVEDNSQTRDHFARILREEGFDVIEYASEQEALNAFQCELPDLALLDICHRDDHNAGYHICSEIRRISRELPIVFLTNRQSEMDMISGYRLGADDFLSKNASPELLVVRIAALLRRVDALRDAGGQEQTFTGGGNGLELDKQRSTVCWNGEHIYMPLTHFWLVKDLCEHPGNVRSYRELMKAAGLVVEPNTISVYIKAIRKAFKACDPAFQCIKTERGRGYRWVAD